MRGKAGASAGKEGQDEFGWERKAAARSVSSVVSGYAGFRPVFRCVGARVAATSSCAEVPGAVGEPVEGLI